MHVIDLIVKFIQACHNLWHLFWPCNS